MRRLICLFLAVVFVLSIVPVASAEDSIERYFTVEVKYSDNIGQFENLNLMVKDNHVFVDAKMIAARFGYQYKEGDSAIAIYNPESTESLPRKVIIFNFNSTQVSNLVLFTMIDSYVAPFESIKNSSGTWIPFEYSLLLMNSGMMLHDGMIFIDIPTKNITDLFFDIAKQAQLYQFDYADDFGHSELDEKVLAGSSRLINVFNGILTMDGDSWLVLFQQFLGSTEAYDKKYAEDIALLLCTESDKELNATIESMDKIVNLFSEDGNLGTILSRLDDSLDKDIGTLYGQCEQLLQKIKDSNVPTVTYNRTYQALETALDKQTWFSETGGTVLQVQKGISSEVPFTMLKVAAVMLEVCGYAREFQNQDAFSVGAVSKYLDINSSDYDLLVTMKKEMDKYWTSISDDLSGYMGMRLQENIGKLVLDFLPKDKALGKIIGAQASSLLLAWDLASAFVPFVKDGLSSADNFELSLYAQIIQNDAFLNYVNERSRAFSSESSINAENLYTVAQLCYTYLKACYITREAALASLKVKPDAVLKRIQPLVDDQNEINEEIAQMLVALKRANNANKYYVYGFLPNDNNHYLSVFDDGKLVNWVTGSSQSQPSVEDDTPAETNADNLVTNASTSQVSSTDSSGTIWTMEYNIPQINLKGGDIDALNQKLYDELNPVITQCVSDIQNNSYAEYDEISYEWAVNGDILSLWLYYHYMPYEYWWWDVYNISISRKYIMSKGDLLLEYGLSEDNYFEKARQAMASSYLDYAGWHLDEVGADDFFYMQLNKTVDAENVDASVPFINQDGELCVVANVYSLAGGDSYPKIISLESFELSPLYSTYVTDVQSSQP